MPPGARPWDRERLDWSTQHATTPAVAVAKMVASLPCADPGRIGRFAVLRRLGEGGMGVVYSAFDELLGRRVAIKLLHHADSEQGRDDARREAQALARLSHPNVVQIYEVGELGDQLFVAMEFITGDTLRAWMQPGDHDWRRTVEVFVPPKHSQRTEFPGSAVHGGPHGDGAGRHAGDETGAWQSRTRLIPAFGAGRGPGAAR